MKALTEQVFALALGCARIRPETGHLCYLCHQLGHLQRNYPQLNDVMPVEELDI